MKYNLTEEQKERVARWIEALRSGEYEQGRSSLKNKYRYSRNTEPKYCCLGVLCDIHAKENHGKWVELQFPNADGSEYRYMGELAVPPVEVRGWVGLDAEDDFPKTCQENRFISDIIRLNDSSKHDFHQIANFIEEELLGK